ncbi:hypothetical protein PG993_005917 [Apiospora rasikravindrae]|uniref:protein-ribulosamine 3-kinase n=1 Tax=Apiospora rasikravindrae TaxID=990691 RepID=A0ABR1TA57_9PEZI
MIEGQFESDKAIYDVSPSFCPEPLAWGKYISTPGPNQYFLLAQFREVSQQPPEPLNSVTQLADLHKRSESPKGKFGFHTTTRHGMQPPSDEYEYHANLVLEKCVGKLLSPLQSNGRSIKPCLVHGDLWDGNTATDVETRKPFIFDGSAFYAHNEYELGNWRTRRHLLGGKAYISTYRRDFPPGDRGQRRQSTGASDGALAQGGSNDSGCVIAKRLEPSTPQKDR